MSKTWQPISVETFSIDDATMSVADGEFTIIRDVEGGLAVEEWDWPDNVRLCRLTDAPAVPTFSHRNGETEPPTVDGWYAMQHPQAWNWQGSTYVFVESNMDEFDVYCAGQDDPIGYHQMDSRIKWYGPIVPPWEANNE